MDVAEKAVILDHFKMILLFGLVGAVTSYFACCKGFFRLNLTSNSLTKIRYPLIGLILYLTIFIFSAPLTIHFLENHFPKLAEMFRHDPVILRTVAQIFSISFIIIFLLLFSFLQPAGTNQSIWSAPPKYSLRIFAQNFGLGVLVWVVVFPVVAFFNHIAEMLNYILFGISGIEQIAVRYLRFVAKSPSLLILALFFILIVAPIIEELVFRGFIQTYFKQKWGFKLALILSSFFFAFFHIAPFQGFGNFPLIVSLFILALFLGFLYERQGCLIAPIALHMTFNSISVIRILLW